MHSFLNFFFLWIFFVLFIKISKSTLSFQTEPSRTILKLCEHANTSCLNDIFIQKFIVLNSERKQNISVKLGHFTRSLMINKNHRFVSKIHSEKRSYFVSSNSNELTINTICEFSYDDRELPFLDDVFCCRIDLELDIKDMENPTSFCELRVQQKSTNCFIPLRIKNTSFLLDRILPLIARVYKKSFGQCQPNPAWKTIYSVSSPLTISFSHNSPVIWKSSTDFPWKVLIGIPIYSVSTDENLLIPVRLIIDQTGFLDEIISLQCGLDHSLVFHSIFANYPNVSVIENYTFVKGFGFYVNIKLRVTPWPDQQLMFLNVTVVLDSRDSDSINSSTVHCCINPASEIRESNVVCKNARAIKIPLKQSYSITIIPAVKDSVDLFAIYSMPIIQFPPKSIIAYGISNPKDKIVKDFTVGASIYPINSEFLTVPHSNKSLKDIEMSYQNFINPWSMQLQFFDTIQTIITPVRVWRPESWKLVMSDNTLRPIKNWAVPESSNNDFCVSRYKAVRLKILCRLYIVEETGEKKYIGMEGDNQYNIPYVDVTPITNVSQLRTTPEDIISIHKNDRDYFLILAQQPNKVSKIELVSMDGQFVFASTRIAVKSDDLFVIDIIVHCIDTIYLAQQNRSLNSVTSPEDHESVTVSLTSNLASKPCYLVVFVVFSDKSVERISLVKQNLYRLFVTRTESDEIINTPVKDSQLVRVKNLPHANISLYEPSACREPRLILTKQIAWATVIEATNNMIPMTKPSTNIYFTTFEKKMSKTPVKMFSEHQVMQINPVHISIYICTGFVAVCFTTFILYKLCCYHHRSLDNGGVPNNYQRSGSGFLEDLNVKVPIRTSNSKNFSALSKCSTNCLRQNTVKNLNNEPYPPLLPPPGPIATNYDLTISDPICNDSAVDSGVEIGKLSSYSSNTCPSNDLCCTMDLYPSCSGTDESLVHHPYPPPQFSNSIIGFYPHKGILEPENQFHDSIMLSSLNSTKTISNLRHPYW